MKYITTIVLAFVFSVSMALSTEKTLTEHIEWSKYTCKSQKRCGPTFVQKGKVTGLLITSNGAKLVAHMKIWKPGTKLGVTITGEIKEGTIVASKVENKKKQL